MLFSANSACMSRVCDPVGGNALLRPTISMCAPGTGAYLVGVGGLVRTHGRPLEVVRPPSLLIFLFCFVFPGPFCVRMSSSFPPVLYPGLRIHVRCTKSGCPVDPDRLFAYDVQLAHYVTAVERKTAGCSFGCCSRKRMMHTRDVEESIPL